MVLPGTSNHGLYRTLTFRYTAEFRVAGCELGVADSFVGVCVRDDDTTHAFIQVVIGSTELHDTFRCVLCEDSVKNVRNDRRDGDRADLRQRPI